MRRTFSDLFDTSKPLIALSPMAGFSCVTYRGICKSLGSDYAPTELTSARSIVMNGVEKSYRFMRINKESEGVTCIQLFGNEPQDFSEAMKIICDDERLQDVDIFDINMGCPVQKVVKTGAGSGLLRTPDIAQKIVEASRKACDELDKVLTVKTRIGFNDQEKNGVEFAKMLANSGAEAICIHGRTAAQMYSGKADREEIARIRDGVKDTGVYFFANGDITDGKSAREMLDITKADGLMVGRGACGNPWIFGQIKEYLQNGDNGKFCPTLSEKCDMLMIELEGRASEVGEVVAVKEMRSVMPHYIKGLPGSTPVKVALCRASTIEEVRLILHSSLG